MSIALHAFNRTHPLTSIQSMSCSVGNQLQLQEGREGQGRGLQGASVACTFCENPNRIHKDNIIYNDDEYVIMNT